MAHLGRLRLISYALIVIITLWLGHWATTSQAATTHWMYLPVVKRLPPTATGPDYGINFINSVEDPGDEAQYQMGLSAGADWTRWPLYWYTAEPTPNSFNWAAHDALVVADLAHGLQINAILMGTPGFYWTGVPAVTDSPTTPHSAITLFTPQTSVPVGLYEPLFTDGSDVPGPGKSINPANVWGRFVYTAVNRYKPGGVLAQSLGWSAGQGVTHWEIWNEPDLSFFWGGTAVEYGRLLKVAYLATKQADASHSAVMFAGLANNFDQLGFYNNVMALYDSDPLAPPYAYFHDIMTTHNYANSWQSWYHVYRANNTLHARNLSKPIWLNETGVAAWNDYPGPNWDPRSPWRATTNEQADFVIQSTLYAMYAGADAIFHFQLRDGCGNQPRGTDFPPHSGELCDANGNLITNPAYPCAGDANGLFSNSTNAACFSHHPSPGSPRPNYIAYQLLTQYVQNVYPIWRQRPGSNDPYNGPQEWIAFYQPATQKRIIGMWARFGTAQSALLTATSNSALLVYPDGTTQTITPVAGIYTIPLPAATNQNYPGDPVADTYHIGGRPVLVIESDPGYTHPPK